MPIFSPPNRSSPTPNHTSAKPGLRLWLKASLLLPACLPLIAACTISAQTLARPGWNGSGFNTDPWWKHAIFYQLDAPPAQEIAARLDALQSLGVDALILPAPAHTAAAPNSDSEAFDELIHQASARNLRVLLTLQAAGANADLTATARLWLSRGVSGFRIVTPPQTSPQDSQAIVQALRKLTSSAVGGRIVIADFNPDSNAGPAAAPPQTRSRNPRARNSASHADTAAPQQGAQLLIDSRLSSLQRPNAANLRPLLAQSLLQPNLLLDFTPPAAPPILSTPDLARIIATIQLTTHPAALIDANPQLALQAGPQAPDATASKLLTTPQPAVLPSPTLADWVRQLDALHRGNATLRYGSLTMLDFDAQNVLVWVARAAPGAGLAAPVVAICNLSSSPAKLSLTAAIKGLGLHGWFLRTLLRSDQAMGAQNLDSVTVPPFGVYIGELHR
jgi:alpha-glucosidase